jgi:hypothetical protein
MILSRIAHAGRLSNVPTMLSNHSAYFTTENKIIDRFN